MSILLSIVVLLAVWGICAYHRLSMALGTGMLTASLIVLTLLGHVGFIFWVIYALVIACVIVPSIRQSLLTSQIFSLFKRLLPTMSQTEKEALDAGTVWWEAELFRGKPDWQQLHRYQAPHLTEEERAFLDGPVNQVCEMVNDYQVSHELADLPPEVWEYLKEQKFFAMIIKKQYGGLEFSAYAQSLVLQKLAGVSGILAITVGVPNSLGPGELLQHYGTEKQKDYYLPRLATGQEIPCFALTSPEAGSDAGSIPDFGVVCKGTWEGKEVVGMRLTWNKRYITLAPVATVLGLAFKLQDPDHLLGEEENIGITCALIPTDMAGVEIGRRHFPLNIPFQNGPTQGKDVFVPLDFIIGGPSMAGNGWRMLVECLSVGRGITLPSNSTGVTKTAAVATGAYARIRRQFKQPIGKMEGIEEPLARLGGNAYLMDAACQLTVTGIMRGEKPSVISAIVKYHCTHRGQQCLKDAMDITGGKGICLGPSNFLAKNYQGAPIAITVEGANILTRSMIIFGQGAIRCHPYVLKEMELAHSQDEDAMTKFDQTLSAHIAYTISNAVRSFWLGLTNGLGSAAPHQDETKRYYQRLNRYSANLAFMADLTMLTLGGSLKRKERVSARLGDLLSQLYLSSATLKRYDDDGRHTEDLSLVRWALEDSLKQMEVALSELLDNYPSPTLGFLLKRILMPFGRVCHGPSDQLDHQVAKLLQSNTAPRNRLGRYQYWYASEHNPAGRIHQALDTIIQAEPIFDKICQLKNKHYPFTNLDQLAKTALDEQLISSDESDLLVKAEQERLYVINVDDFAPDALAAGSPDQPKPGKAKRSNRKTASPVQES
ncbi:acyl-CoA dehydrogenase FadE [Vibrio rhizosphaerae]|uniref:acyl-CoA dehydrogenase FadE n=1 Tax=Vibrio rhizosphaerae TaxID=398736 RepID=UPI00069154FE|nr:acyl-CoA dehydrogenase FadE [Vibrio rhizosphaerae]